MKEEVVSGWRSVPVLTFRTICYLKTTSRCFQWLLGLDWDALIPSQIMKYEELGLRENREEEDNGERQREEMFGAI